MKSRELKIGNKHINDESDAYVIAEVGNNHQGSVEKCLDIFQAAQQAGVDAVKLQKRNNRSLYTRELYDKPYDNENSFGATYGEHRDFLELDKRQYQELQAACTEMEIDLFATAFDFPSADFLADLEMPAYKIASGDLRSIPLIKYVAQIGKPMIISTGGATMDDVRRAVDAVAPINDQFCLLQCTATYPTAPEDMHLRVIETYREEFPETVVGLSDHYDGIAVAPVAYMLGARVMEKHFTLHHTWKGTDHAFSLEPPGMGRMVRDLRRCRLALGNREKTPLPQEEKAIAKMGKSIVAARELPAGHLLTREDLVFKSPGGGLPPYRDEELLGRGLARGVVADHPFTLEDFA